MKKIISKVLVAAVLVFMAVIVGGVAPVAALGDGLTMSPMNQKIVINPGDSYQTSFKLSNPVNSTEAVDYELSVEPFYINGRGETVLEGDIEEEHVQMVDWIKFDVPVKGRLEPNQVDEILFTINVPESAPAGGQYAMVTATVKKDDKNVDSDSSNKDKSSAAINEVKRMGHLVYAEITGNVIRKGEIIDANVTSFLLSGDIAGTATVKNTGNVHGATKLTLQVLPLFSDEEVYTNEELPAGATILPNREYYAEVAWKDTPAIGIYNVKFKVEFEGEITEVSKMVIKMPVWLLFIIIFVMALLIIWIVMKVKNRGKRKNATFTTGATGIDN